jgi:xanthine dehydrogenase YagS FAD-binding subunit
MIPFQYDQPETLSEASSQLADSDTAAIAGGTTMLDLMKINVLMPKRLCYVKPLLDNSVKTDGDHLVIGAGCTMSALADHKIVRDRFPVIRQSLILAASPQIRNMATIGGNLLQRTRSTYFRHPDMPIDHDKIADAVWSGAQNELSFGEGVETSHLAVLGNHGRLVSMYPGDFAIALVAFNAEVVVDGQQGTRSIPARDFYIQPENQFQYDTALESGEIITAIKFPRSPALEHSIYLKIRERSSYAFALASTALGLHFEGSGKQATITAAQVGIGGLGSVPWPSPEAEAALVGQQASDSTFAAAADAALADANPPAGLEFKVPLAHRTLVRAMKILRDRGPLSDEQLWTMQHGRG